MAGQPIYILGTERSGSNLVRLILNSHPRMAVAHPPHAVRYFTPLMPAYGDLAREDNFRALVRDVLRLLEVHVHPWNLAIDAERVVHEARPRDALGITAALYDQYREAHGKARWACKSTFMVEHVAAILARDPGAKLLLLVRDPRDVAVSSRDSVFSSFHPFFTARLWDAQQRTGLAWVERLPPSTMRVVHYEALVREPECTVRELCSFIEEDFHPDMLRFFETQEAQRSGALSESWRRTAEPIRDDTVARWKGALSDAEVRLVESACGDTMSRLGYTPANDSTARLAARPGPARLAVLWLIERLLHLRVEWRSIRRDKNVGLRWRRGWLLWRLRARARTGRVA
ncbi:MAG: sulfotransferase [Deltaproteobacteria bacterium]|nr:sulfotransferase [Deltaproteobacteria bacterium]